MFPQFMSASKSSKLAKETLRRGLAIYANILLAHNGYLPGLTPLALWSSSAIDFQSLKSGQNLHFCSCLILLCLGQFGYNLNLAL